MHRRSEFTFVICRQDCDHAVCYPYQSGCGGEAFVLLEHAELANVPSGVHLFCLGAGQPSQDVQVVYGEVLEYAPDRG